MHSKMDVTKKSKRLIIRNGGSNKESVYIYKNGRLFSLYKQNNSIIRKEDENYQKFKKQKRHVHVIHFGNMKL